MLACYPLLLLHISFHRTIVSRLQNRTCCDIYENQMKHMGILFFRKKESLHQFRVINCECQVMFIKLTYQIEKHLKLLAFGNQILLYTPIKQSEETGRKLCAHRFSEQVETNVIGPVLKCNFQDTAFFLQIHESVPSSSECITLKTLILQIMMTPIFSFHLSSRNSFFFF